jgi:hypothetical protein
LLDELARSNQSILPAACCLLLSSASICIHQPPRSITRHAEDFGTLIIENRRFAGLTPGLVSRDITYLGGLGTPRFWKDKLAQIQIVNKLRC